MSIGQEFVALKKAYKAKTMAFLGHVSTLQRLERAMDILTRDSIYSWVRVSAGRYLIQNLESAVEYSVDTVAKTCTCPDHENGNICKHRLACELLDAVKKEIGEE